LKNYSHVRTWGRGSKPEKKKKRKKGHAAFFKFTEPSPIEKEGTRTEKKKKEGERKKKRGGGNFGCRPFLNDDSGRLLRRSATSRADKKKKGKTRNRGEREGREGKKRKKNPS